MEKSCHRHYPSIALWEFHTPNHVILHNNEVLVSLEELLKNSQGRKTDNYQFQFILTLWRLIREFPTNSELIRVDKVQQNLLQMSNLGVCPCTYILVRTSLYVRPCTYVLVST